MTENKENNDIKTSNEASNKEDEELSALLDNALEDFNTSKIAKDSSQSSQEQKADERKPEPPQSLWNEEFLQQTTARFEQNIQALFSPGADGTFSAEQLGENIQRLAEAATQTAGFDASPDTEFSSIIAQTLKNLSENAENLQSQLSEEDLMNLIGTFGNITEPSGDPNRLLPIMQHMMQNLLSKDILYPALSGIVQKYPQWLEENKSKLSSADFERYSKQLDAMKEVCAELDKETIEESQEEKNARFDHILALMQKIQDSGQPPVELAASIEPMVQLDEHGNPQLPGSLSTNQCNLM